MFIAPILSSLARALGTVAEAAVVLDTAAAPQVEAGVPSSESESDFGILPGRWVRPDGGYVITIKSVDATGKLDAAYANPSPLPFAKAERYGTASPSSCSSNCAPAATTGPPCLSTTR